MSRIIENSRFLSDVRKYSKSYDFLEHKLKEYIDFDPDKLRGTLFEYACLTLEREGFRPSEYKSQVQFLMKLKLTDILKKVYHGFQERKDEDVSLDFRISDIENLVNFEHDYKENASFPWAIVTRKNTDRQILSNVTR